MTTSNLRPLLAELFPHKAHPARRDTIWRLSSFWLLAVLPFLLPDAVGQQPQIPDPTSKIVAKVDGESILVREVEREIRIAYGDRPIAEDARDFLQATTLEQLVKRKLVLQWLAETKQAASPEQVENALVALQQRLAKRGGTLERFLDEQQLDETGIRQSLAWQIAWQRYLDKQLTDRNLEKYFDKHRRDFDGTEVRVAHILVKVDDMAAATSWAAARDRASQLLAEIRAGKLSFADAARAHSDSPSRDAGGDIGFIARHEPMPEAFSKAVFALNPLEVSEPITTAFGVHLIQCLEIKPSAKQWTEVRDELELAVTNYLFDWAAGQVRTRTQVEYAVDFPHFQSGTEVLAGSSK